MKRTNLLLATLAVLGITSSLFFTVEANAAPIIIGTIKAEYATVNSGDNTRFTFTNLTAAPITNVVLTGTGISGSFTPTTGTKNLADIPASGFVVFAFNNTSSTGSTNPFHNDFDDFFFGSVQYSLSGLWNGVPISLDFDPFSPSSNASGGFLGFLGNNAAGSGSDPIVQPTVVANILANEVPEPTSMALFGIMAVSGAVYGWRRRKPAVV